MFQEWPSGIGPSARVRKRELTGEDKSLVSVAAGREIEILKLSVQDADKERCAA